VEQIIIVGAGPAGIGMGIVLTKLGIKYSIIEKHSIGYSFEQWPKETRFISPSFTGNFFKMPDLNTVSPDTSPAFSLQTEHPSGIEYAKYLRDVAQHYDLPIETGIVVKSIKKTAKGFELKTNKKKINATYVIWAAGEFQYPNTDSFEGSDLCIHHSSIKSFNDLKGDGRIVIGGYESGFDSALNISKLGNRVILLDAKDHLFTKSSDSSYSLSPYTRDKIKENKTDIDYHKNTVVEKVVEKDGTYTVYTNNATFETQYAPINATGYRSSLTLVQDLFEFDGKYPKLTDDDQSTITPNLFLTGPQVKHDNALFCFIYKFRQRFAVIARKIATDMDLPQDRCKEIFSEYRKYNFFLDDLSCCNRECTC